MFVIILKWLKSPNYGNGSNVCLLSSFFENLRLLFVKLIIKTTFQLIL